MDSTLKELKDFAETALEIKKAGRSVHDIQAACTAGSLLLLRCREQSRVLALDADHTREETATRRASLDHASLQLHNLVYEQQYYDKEIASCRTFQPSVSDERLQCISLQDFVAQPEKASVLVGKTAHEVELARLNNELQQRKQLKAELQRLQQQKQRAQSDLNAAAARIDDLRTHMEGLVQSSRPLMETSLPDTSAIKSNKEAAELLPLPLYIIYSQAITGSSVVGLPLKAEIEGSTAAAATIAAAGHARQAAPPAEAVQSARKRRKSEPQDDHTYKVHPLSVTINVQSSSQATAETVMQLTFQYYLQLKLVGVSASTPEDEEILTDLFMGDAGDGQLLENVAAVCSSGACQFGVPGRPRPFRWAQDLAGVDVVSSLPSSFTAADADKKEQVLAALSAYRSQLQLETFVERLTAAKQGRHVLTSILRKLSKKEIPSSSWDSKLVTKIYSFIHKWQDTGNAQKYSQQQLQQPVVVPAWQAMQVSAAEEGEVAGTAADSETTSRLMHGDTTEEDLLQGLLAEDVAVAVAAGVDGSNAARAAAAATTNAQLQAANADETLMLEEGALLDDFDLAYEQNNKQPSEQGEVSAASDDNVADAEAPDAGQTASSTAVQVLQARYSLYKLSLRSSVLEVQFNVKVFANYPLCPPVFSVVKVLDLTTKEPVEGSKKEKGGRRQEHPQLTAVNEVLRLEQQANSLAVWAASVRPAEVLAVQVVQLCQLLDLLSSQFRAMDRVDKLKAKQQLRGRERQPRLMWCNFV